MLLFYAKLNLAVNEYKDNFILTKKAVEPEEQSYKDQWLVNNKFEINNTICESISPILHKAHNYFVLVVTNYLKNVEDYLQYIPFPVFLNNYHRFLKKQRDLYFDTDPFNRAIKCMMMSFLTDDNHFLKIKDSIYKFYQTEKKMPGYFKMFFQNIDEKLLNISKFYELSPQTQKEKMNLIVFFMKQEVILKKV